MTEKMTAYIVALNFKDGPLVINAVLAPYEYAAAAMVTALSIQQMKIEQPLRGVAVAALTPEFIDAARLGGEPATVVSLVPKESVPDLGPPPPPSFVSPTPLSPSPAMTVVFGPDPEPPAA